jgi:hypothetical protein
MAGIDAQTVLCLHCDGADTSTTFTDSSQYTHTVTANGNAQIDTAQSKFGGASALFDGAGDYLSSADHADYQFGSGDFTIDFWVRFNATAGTYIVMTKRPGGATFGEFMFLMSAGTLSMYMTTSTSAWDIYNGAAFATGITAGAWHHVAVVRSGNNFATYWDGTQVVTTTNAGSLAAASGVALGIGGDIDAGLSMNGWLDEIRISKGVARWTSSFTPPAAAYTINAPTNSVAPVASGTPTVGQTLTTTNGTWTGSPSFAYQWQRDNTGGGSYSNIGSATASTYLLVSGDTSCNVRCVVTATNAGGSTAANSNALGPTAAAGPAAYPYVDLVPSYDLDNVFNRWTVTRDQGSPQMAEDTTSQAKYFLRAKQTATLVSDDTAALAQAARKIAKFKDPQNRIESMTIQPLTDLTNTAQIDAGLGRDIGHVITIKETPPGFAAVQTKNYVIQSISGQINAGPMTSMTLTFGVWPA